MPFRPIEAEKISAAVVKQLEELILRGILRPGERLPAERELAERLEVSRPSLREALADMQEKGLLSTRASAGVYVEDSLAAAFAPALMDLFARHREAVFDYLSFRRDMEGLAAERAAKQASDTDLRVIETIFAQMEEASNTTRQAEAEARLDAQFHMAIVEASHNVIMLHMMRSMYRLLQEGVFYNRKVMFKHRTTRAHLLDQHRAINAALQRRDPAGARQAVEAHLDYVAECLQNEVRAEANEEVARLRLDHVTDQS